MSTDLHQQLAAYGDLFVSRLDTLTVEEVMVKRTGDGSVKTLEPVEPKRRRRGRGLLAAAALVVSLVAIGATALLVSGGSESAPTVPAGTGVTTVPDGAGVTDLPQGWARVPSDEALFGDASIVAVTHSARGYVAVGTDAFAQNGKVWLSPDGWTWELVAAGGVFADAAPTDVIAGGPGLVAIGADHANGAAVWTSIDGRSWTKVPLDPASIGEDARFNAIASLGTQLVVVGQYGVRDQIEEAAWASNDGASWRRVDLPGVAQPLDVVTGGPGLVAVGSVDELGQMIIWTSADGTTWEIATDEHLADPVAIAAGESALLAIGPDYGIGLAEPPGTSTVLASSDGTSWEVRQRLDGSFSAIGHEDGHYIAVGSDPESGEALAFHSVDGRTWDGDHFGDGRMTDVTGSGSTVVVVGKSGLRDGAIWTHAGW